MYAQIRSQWNNLVDERRNRRYDKVLKDWLSRMQPPELDLGARTFVFNTTRASRRNLHLYTDLFLGYLIAKNGGTAYILLDDGVLQLWDTVQINRLKGRPYNVMRSPQARKSIKRDLARLAEIFATPNLHVLWYSEFLPEHVEEDLSDEDEAFAVASTIRHFEEGALDLNKPAQLDYHRLSRENAKISKALGRYVVEQIKPDVFATSHGIYSTWGPAYKFVKNSGLATRVYSKHPYKFGGMVIRADSGNSFDREELERYLDEAQFGAEQRKEAKDYLDARFSHQTVDTKVYFADTLSKVSDNSVNYQKSEYEITLGLFPNIVWDAIGWENEGLYSNVIDWMVDTVRTIGEDGRYRLIVRYHPSEATLLQGSIPSHQHIAAVLPEIETYPNVVLIQAEEPVNSYQLMRDSIDVALIYTTSFGAEAQLLDVPVVAVASGRFSDRLVHRVRSREEYRETIKDPQRVIDEFQGKREQIVEDIYKYHYFVNEEMYCPIGIMGKSSPSRIATVEELNGDQLLDQRGVEKALRRLDINAR